jgi:hypothetical protein
MTSKDEHLPRNSLNGTTRLPGIPLLAPGEASGEPLSKLTVKDRSFTFYARIIQELLLKSNQERGM